jgi:hypothetical protein
MHPINYEELYLKLLSTDSTQKVNDILKDAGTPHPKDFDWKRFFVWFESAPAALLKQITIPGRPYKCPIFNMLEEWAGKGPADSFVDVMYHAKWEQTKQWLQTDLEKFTRMWAGTDYAMKKKITLSKADLEYIYSSICKLVIPQFKRWGLDKGPGIINALNRVMKTLGSYGEQSIDPAHELGGLFLQSTFFDKDVRRNFRDYVGSNYILVARAMGLDPESVESLDSAFLLKITKPELEKMNDDQKTFVKIEEEWAANPKNKTKYVIHDLSLTPEEAILKAWKTCLGTVILRAEAFNTQIKRLAPSVGGMDKLFALAETELVLTGISEYIRDLGTPGLGLILSEVVSWVMGESHELRQDYFKFFRKLNDAYASKYPNMVSPKATFYMAIIAVEDTTAWSKYLTIVPHLPYVSKLPDMMDSERMVFNLSAANNKEMFQKICDDVLLPQKAKLVWNDARTLLMILQGLGYEEFQKFNFTDAKVQEAYEVLARTSPKSPYLKLLASQNMKVRNEVFANIQKRMALGGLYPVKFCDPSRNLADLPGDIVPELVKSMFAKSFDQLKIGQWHQDVLGSKSIYEKSPWMVDTFIKKIEARAHEALDTGTHSIHSMVTVSNALPSSALTTIINLFPEGSLKTALKADTPRDVAELVKIIDNLSEQHTQTMPVSTMIKIIDAIETSLEEKENKNDHERQHQEAIRLGICDIISKWTEHRDHDAETLFAHIKMNPTLKPFVLEYFANYSAVNSMAKLLNTSVIKPSTAIAPDRLRLLLKYNNVPIPATNKMSYDDLEKLSNLKQVLDTKNQAKLVFRDLAVNKVNRRPPSLRSVQLNSISTTSTDTEILL